MSTTERTSTLAGTWKNGQVILDSPADWPEGCRVIVEPIPDLVETLGISEAEWPTTPGAVAEWLEWFDSIEPIEMTPPRRGGMARMAAKSQKVHDRQHEQADRGALRMRRYLLDTGVAGDFIARRRGVDVRVRDATIQGNIVGICVPVLGELWGGMELSATRDRNIDRMRHALARLRIWPFDVKAAKEYGRKFASLQRKGRTIQQVDIQIAAIALSLSNVTVVTTDGDLSVVPGLSVESWTS